MNTQIAEECGKLSEEEQITFPEVIERLTKAGIESYTANLLVPNKIYIGGNKSHEMRMSIKAELHVAATFNQESVVQALRAIQSNQIGYTATA